MPAYLLHGVRVESPIPLGPVEDDGPADIEIVASGVVAQAAALPAGEVLVHRATADHSLYTGVALEDGGHLLRLHGLCDFVVEPQGRRVRCIRIAGIDTEIIGLVSRGALLAFYLGLTGNCVLHAAAVDLDGAALLFAGDSGMGKSTLAAMACHAGAGFIADDLVRLAPDPFDHWLGTSHELRLRPGAGGVLAEACRSWEPRQSVDGRITVRPPRCPASSGPVAAVVVPRLVRDASRFECTRLDPVEAAVLIGAFGRLPGWRHLSAAEVQLAGAVGLARSVPVVVATVPWSSESPDMVMKELLAALSVLEGSGGRR